MMLVVGWVAIVLAEVSTKIWSALPLRDCPTAVQFAAATQDTPLLSELPLGLGLGTIDQVGVAEAGGDPAITEATATPPNSSDPAAVTRRAALTQFLGTH